MDPRIPRPEYPRPQMVRSEWLNLNGEWQFEIDPGRSGRERGLVDSPLRARIVVPFCPESTLSGVGNKDFMPAVWYRRSFDLPQGWNGRRILIHFGAVDYKTEAWVNGRSVGTHEGGYSSFTFDITSTILPENNVITVCAEDDIRSRMQPRGKQSALYHSQGGEYTRTTGIWQTVWLECVNDVYVTSLKIYSDPGNARVHIEAKLNQCVTTSTAMEIQVLYADSLVGKETALLSGQDGIRTTVSLSEVHLWGVGHPHLYDVRLTLRHHDRVVDELQSYIGLRTISIGNNAICINGAPVFQRLVLDQGFYADGVYTAPSDAALRQDIELSQDLGFNGARLHQKIFEERYLYWADRLGYLVWEEHANWGLDISSAVGLEKFLPEWMDTIHRDFNHPAIVGWCPFNETWDSFAANTARQDNDVLRIVYQVTKAIDATRPVIDTSGHFHVLTDVFDVHDYEQDPVKFAETFEPMKQGDVPYNPFPTRQTYDGQPYFVSEFGGIWWGEDASSQTSWGYGTRPGNEQEFLDRYEQLATTLLAHPRICAFCYTQLYDIEQETNGLYTYDRKPKFDPSIIRTINQQPAAIEASKPTPEAR